MIIRNLTAALLLATVICCVPYYGHAQANPGREWSYSQDPASAGWDMAALTNLERFVIDSTQVTGMMIIHKGVVVFAYGDVSETSYIASCRKSVLAMLYGKHVAAGRIDLDETLQSLGVDDVGGLSASEQQATVRDVLSARSGVFHAASNPGDYLEYAPKRGSVGPGEYWLYSNWDFNLAGYILEKKSGIDLYDDLETTFASPLQLQDWKRGEQQKRGDSTRSIYPAYHMWFSTRDMARIGQLMLNKGRWGAVQVLDSSWVKEMVAPHTDFSEVNRNIPAYRGADFYLGYGYYWWLWQQTDDQRFEGGYSALGAMGQTISVFPNIDAVVVYKTKAAYDRDTSFANKYKLIQKAVTSIRK